MVDSSRWVSNLITSLQRSGPKGRAVAGYIRQRGIAIGLHTQPTAARWTLRGKVELHPRYADGPADSPYAMSLIVHEVRHLQQGFLTALSVYGEMEAWQAQFRFLRALRRRVGQAQERGAVISELVSLPLGWDRSTLRRARTLMRSYAGGRYRINLLPLYPVHRELLFRLLRRMPEEGP